MDICFDRGLYLPALDLWLDATRSRVHSVTSHAHSDHIGRHERFLSTPLTARLIAQRQRGRRYDELPFGRPLHLNGATLTLLPSGHIRGSAQMLIEQQGERLLYSGDLRLGPSLTAEPAEPVPADTLIVEATFGRARYRFPAPEAVAEQIVAFCRETLADGGTPVLFAYSLGKSQEVMARLAGHELRLAVHPTIAALADLYRQDGAPLGEWELLGERPVAGAVVICPPQWRTSAGWETIPRPRTAFVSGWAVDPRRRYQMGVDAAFALSDHADYDELLAYVRAVAPERVFTIYGYASELAADLCALGYDAQPLAGPMQARLF